MRIAQVSTLCTPVRGHHSGSIEYLVWLLTRELTRMGHDVTVFATPESETEGRLVSPVPGPYGENGAPDDWYLCEWTNLCRAVEQSAEFDVLHAHAYLWGLPLDRLSKAPMVHTMHTVPYDDEARSWALNPWACVTGISHFQWHAYPELKPSAVVYHGVDTDQFTFRAQPDDYVCYLGRFIEAKGAELAIETARKLGIRIRVAGPEDDDYRSRIEPLIDGKNVEFVGWVNPQEKDALLGGARALLYPLLEPEPFGLVQVEAMLTGTPVAAIGIGAVPEVVDEGVTGCYSPDPAGFESAVRAALALDRSQVRRHAEQRFSIRRMAEEYLCVYERLIASRRQRC